MGERVRVMTSDDEFRLSITPGPGDLVLDALADNVRRIAELQAEQVRLLAEFAKLRPGRGKRRFSEFAADEVAITLQLTHHAAHVRLDRAVTMTAQVPQVLDALENGVIDQWRADVIVDGVQRLPDAAAQQVADRVLDRAGELNVSEVRRIMRRAVVRYDTAGAQRRERDARAGRRVEFTPCDDGMAALWAYLPANEATTIHRRLDAFARDKAPGDGRTHDQRRADAFVDLTLNPALGPIVTTVHLTMPADGMSTATIEPAVLDGYGPITAARGRDLALGYATTGGDGTDEYARKLVADPKWRQLITDPASGAPVELSAKGYRPTAALAEFVRARDQYCAFPGCLYPARACDIDHRVPYPDGPTAAGNLNCLCRHHHRLKQEDGWRLLKRGRSYVWINPAGITYIRTPEATTEPQPTAIPPPADDPPF
jgi:Domain of unknown function (DUF222)